MVRLNIISLLFTVGAIGALLLAVGAVVVFPLLLAGFGLAIVDQPMIGYLRWPVMFVLVILGLAVLYRYGASRRPAKWRWTSVGSVFAASAWLAVSSLFAWYLGNFANYNATYGALGAVVGLMMWMWLSIIVVLVGAELNSEIEHQTSQDSTVGPCQAARGRGAVVAGHVEQLPGGRGTRQTSGALMQERRVEGVVEFFRAQREKADALIISDPHPLASMDDIWGTAAQMATVGIFVLLLIPCLYFSRAILLPVLAAVLIGTTFAPIIRWARHYGVSSWATAVALVVLMIAVASIVVTLLAAPVTEWIGKAPEIGARIQQQLYVLDRPLAAFHELETALMPAAPTVAVESSKISMVTPVVEAVTPAVAQGVLFFAALIFVLAGQMEFRRYMAALFATHEGKLRFIRIANDVEHNIASYVAVVTVINCALGLIVGVGAWLFGLPNPLILGIVAMLLNYIPYLGPACMAIVLFAVGLVTFSRSGRPSWRRRRCRAHDP